MFKRFFVDLKNSIYDPEFYAALRGRRLSSAFGFLLGLCLISAVVFVIVVFVSIVPNVNRYVSPEAIASRFPEKLEIRIKNGIATSNADRPIQIAMPTDEKAASTSKGFAYLALIDTSHDFTRAEIASSSAFAVLSRDSLAIQMDNGEVRIFPLSGTKDLTLNRTTVSALSEKFFSAAKIAAVPFALFAIIMCAAFSFIYYALAMLLGALLIWGYSALRRTGLSYKQSYATGLYALGPVVIVESILFIFGIQPVPAGVSLILFIVVILANIQPVPAAPQDQAGTAVPPEGQ